MAQGFPETVIVNHIRPVTRSAGSLPRGTIVAKKKGDWMWWILSIALLAGVAYTAYHPQWLYRLLS